LNIKLLSIIYTSVKVNKLLPVLFLFAGFQAHAGPITTVGNLSYDGTIISGDGRTYIGFDTLRSLTYQQTLDKITTGAFYSGYRFANTEDTDYFIGSLFGDQNDSCSITDGVAHNRSCGTVPGWSDGIFGQNYNSIDDRTFFLADESQTMDVGYLEIDSSGFTIQRDEYYSIEQSDKFSEDGEYFSDGHVSWLLVKNSNASNAVPTPSSFAIFVLGLAGIGFARRRRS
jgi:hypothetical protein